MIDLSNIPYILIGIVAFLLSISCHEFAHGYSAYKMGDYTAKLTHIIARNEIRSLTIVRMEVPCCGGIENAAKRALQSSGKFIPWQVVTISTDGRILDR